MFRLYLQTLFKCKSVLVLRLCKQLFRQDLGGLFLFIKMSRFFKDHCTLHGILGPGILIFKFKGFQGA